MSIAPEGASAISEPLSIPEVRKQSAGRLILLAIGWLVVANIVSGVPVGVASVILRRQQLQEAFGSSPTAFIVMMVLASGVLIFAACKQARIVGDGGIKAGVGDASISRRWLLTLLALLTIAWAFVVTAAWAGIAPQTIDIWRAESPWVLPLFTVVIAIMPPLAEEIFFRGWLWVGLRRHYGGFVTALITGGLFAAAHIDRGLLTVITLIPLAIILGVVRHHCGLRASIIIHSLNDLTGALTLALLVSALPA